MNAVISPEEQIRRVARALLALPHRGGPTDPANARPDLRGLIAMIDQHLEGSLAPIEVAPDQSPRGTIGRPDTPIGH